MVNPFDRNFFRFVFGFFCILAVSFAVIYVTDMYTTGSKSAEAIMSK